MKVRYRVALSPIAMRFSLICPNGMLKLHGEWSA